MQVATIILLYSISTFSATNIYTVFVDQIDNGYALICSNESSQWVCKTISLEALETHYGVNNVTGYLYLEEPFSLGNKK
tara:strand:+ start:4857 stop:5093 length:237 start_codon:yes stop_codon:yes gene_type:complete